MYVFNSISKYRAVDILIYASTSIQEKAINRFLNLNIISIGK